MIQGPRGWPPSDGRATDRQLLHLIEAGDVAGALSWLPAYAENAHIELGGRHLGEP